MFAVFEKVIATEKLIEHFTVNDIKYKGNGIALILKVAVGFYGTYFWQ